MPRPWPSPAPLRLVAVAAVLACAGCASPLEQRQTIIAVDGEWRLGAMQEDSFELMVLAVQGLGDQPAGDEARLAAVPDLLRLVLKNPSSFVRAEALRSAWQLGSTLPVLPYRVDSLERLDFNQRTQRLEELMNADKEAALAAGVPETSSPATLELALWLATFHAPPEAPDIAVAVAEVVLSQALYREDALGEAFRSGMEDSLRHALVLTTLHAASDPYPVVREEALASARHLHADTAVALVAGVLRRENDSAVVLAALESLAMLGSAVPAEDLREAVEPLAGSTDVAVRSRIRDLLAVDAG